MENHTFYSVLTSEKGHFSFVNSITFFSYNSYILGTHLIINLISLLIISFQNLKIHITFSHFGYHGNHMLAYSMANSN